MFTHIRLLPGVGPEVGLEVLQARVRFGAALELQRDRNRQTDGERERLPECSVVLVGSWAEKRAGQQRKKKKKKLCVFQFSNVIYSWSRAHQLWRATQKQNSATLW